MQTRRKGGIDLSSLIIMGLTISANSKTGKSINVSRKSCRPTALCRKRCYGEKITLEDIARMEAAGIDVRCLRPNAGPITWDKSQETYERNFNVLQAAYKEGWLDELAAEVSAYWIRHQPEEVLRGNGLGDLWPPLCDFYARLAMHGVPVFLFSRKAEMISRLRETCNLLEVEYDRRPWVIGSVDPSTEKEDLSKLQTETLRMNGQVTLAATWYDPTDRLLWHEPLENWQVHEAGVRVIFGYHTNFHHTRVPQALQKNECPATAGLKTTCRECRKCFGRHA